jgi:hypothetical protein
MAVQVAQGKINNGPGYKIVIDSKALDDMLKGPNGVVVRFMIQQAEKVQAAAKRQCGYSSETPTSGRGHLRDSIVKRIMANGNAEPIVMVGSSHPIALIHHNGTRPHVIYPRTASVLAFPSDSAPNGVQFAMYTNHPGTQPNRYLTDNLRLITT